MAPGDCPMLRLGDVAQPANTARSATAATRGHMETAPHARPRTNGCRVLLRGDRVGRVCGFGPMGPGPLRSAGRVLIRRPVRQAPRHFNALRSLYSAPTISSTGSGGSGVIVVAPSKDSDEGENQQRLEDRISGPHTPAEGVAQVLAGRRADERVGQTVSRTGGQRQCLDRYVPPELAHSMRAPIRHRTSSSQWCSPRLC